jgi:hypothetical protein
MEGQVPAIQGQMRRGIGRGETEPASDATRCGTRVVQLRESLSELRTRLQTINQNITGHSTPEDGNKAPKPIDNLSQVVADLEAVASDCNRLAHAIEANLS